jgi:hypothetical protein
MHELVCGRMVVFSVLTKGLRCWIRSDKVSLRECVVRPAGFESALAAWKRGAQVLSDFGSEVC